MIFPLALSREPRGLPDLEHRADVADEGAPLRKLGSADALEFGEVCPGRVPRGGRSSAPRICACRDDELNMDAFVGGRPGQTDLLEFGDPDPTCAVEETGWLFVVNLGAERDAVAPCSCVLISVDYCTAFGFQPLAYRRLGVGSAVVARRRLGSRPPPIWG